MINEILIYISNGLIIVSLVLYTLLILINRRKKIGEITGFDVIKDMLSEYDRINIIEGNNYFSFYNIKRKVIKLSKKDYYGNDLSALSLSIIEASISVDKSKFITMCSKIIPTLKIMDLLFIIGLIVNYVSFTISDAKIGIIIVGFIIVLHYLYVDILNNTYKFIDKNIKGVSNIKKDNVNNITKFINKFIMCHKIQFIAEIMIVIRMVAIILNM